MKKNIVIRSLPIYALLVASLILAATATAFAADVEAAKKMVDERLGQPDFVLLDVRSPGEYKAAHIEGATFINFHTDQFPDQIAALDRDKEYLIYCATGGRSSVTMRLMRSLGFTRITHMDGGIMDWAREGYPVKHAP